MADSSIQPDARGTFPDIRRAVLLSIVIIATACAPCPADADHDFWPAAGSERHGWFVGPAPGLGGASCALFHIDGSDPPGVIRAVAPLAIRPEWMAAEGERVVLVFPQDQAGVRQVREVNARRVRERTEYSRFLALAPMVHEGALNGLALVSGEVVALLHSQPPAQNRLGPSVGVGLWELFVLNPGGWDELALPADVFEGIDPDRSSFALARIDEYLALISVPTRGNGAGHSPGRVWLLDPPRETLRVRDEWELPPSVGQEGGTLYWGIGTRLAAVGSVGEALSFAVLMRDAASPRFTTSKGRESGAWLIVGDVVWRIRSSGSGTIKEGGQLRCDVWTMSGAPLFSGPAVIPGPVTRRDIQNLALLLGLVMATATVFVLRPGAVRSRGDVLPPAVQEAGPGRRIVAAVLDALPALLATTLSLGVPIGSAGQLIEHLAFEHGAWLMLVSFGATVAHCALGDRLFGRTLGKAILGCRTIGGVRQVASSVPDEEPRITFTRVSWSQAILRNSVRFLCPPLVLLLMVKALSPRQGGARITFSEPWGFGTWVVVRSSRPAGE